MKKTIFTTLIFNVAFLTASAQQAGDLDLTFSSDGKQTTDIGSGDDWGRSLAIQSNGKIIVAGTSTIGTNNVFSIVRYNSDGSLDNTFSGDGKQTTDLVSGDEQGKSVTIQADGKIVVAGYSTNGTNNDFAIIRYNSDGSLDNSFSGDGKQTTDIASGDDQVNSVAIQSDGKIVVAGRSTSGITNVVTVVRYNSDGSLDNTFSGDGIQTTVIGDGDDRGNSLAIQSDGKIVVSGNSGIGGKTLCAVVRYNSNGSLDNTFSGDGIQTTLIGTNNTGNSVSIQSNGKIVVVGSSENGNNVDVALVRYNTDGSLDNTFSGDGIQTTDYDNKYDDEGTSLAIQADGKIVIVGTTTVGANVDFITIRYNSDGSIDNSFSFDGKQYAAFGSSYDWAYSVAIQSDGKIVVAGMSDLTLNTDYSIVRYIGAGSVGVQSPITNLNEIKIFPNPTMGQLIINVDNLSSMNTYTLRIVNVLAQPVFSTLINHQLLTLDFDNFGGKGIYFLEIYDSGNVKIDTRKIILQ
jgi:uncharacterized delta-60 repeat protein